MVHFQLKIFTESSQNFSKSCLSSAIFTEKISWKFLNVVLKTLKNTFDDPKGEMVATGVIRSTIEPEISSVMQRNNSFPFTMTSAMITLVS